MPKQASYDFSAAKKTSHLAEFGASSKLGCIWSVARSLAIAMLVIVSGTLSYPSDVRGTYLGGPDQPIALRIYGTAHERSLISVQSEVTLGREGDIRFDYPCPHLSELHARLTPDGNFLRVEDISSRKNPIIFESRAATSFHLPPGGHFQIGKIKYYALSHPMQMSRMRIASILGENQHSAADDCVINAVRFPDKHIVIIAEQGSEQDVLADAMHKCSPLRHNCFVSVDAASMPGTADLSLITKARNGTLLVWVPKKTRFDQVFVQHAVESPVRMIICVHAAGKVAKSFPPSVTRNSVVMEIPALRKRKDEIPLLLDRMFVEGHSSLRFSQMRQVIQDRLLAYRWPDNLRELRRAAEHLRMLTHYSSERECERDKTATRAESRHWRDKLRIPLPIVPRPDLTKTREKRK